MNTKTADLRKAEKTMVEKAGEALGFGIAAAQDIAGSVKTAVGGAVAKVTEALKKAPATRASVNKVARTASAKKAAKKTPPTKAIKKSARKRAAKKSTAKKAAKNVRAKNTAAKDPSKPSKKTVNNARRQQ